MIVIKIILTLAGLACLVLGYAAYRATKSLAGTSKIHNS